MRLSDLQKYILKNIWRARSSHLNRRELENYYKSKPHTPPEEQRVKIITRSLERLIAKGLLIAYGHKTQEKFFIEDVRLTIQGRRIARELAGKQMRLPLKSKLKKKK